MAYQPPIPPQAPPAPPPGYAPPAPPPGMYGWPAYPPPGPAQSPAADPRTKKRNLIAAAVLAASLLTVIGAGMLHLGEGGNSGGPLDGRSHLTVPGASFSYAPEQGLHTYGSSYVDPSGTNWGLTDRTTRSIVEIMRVSDMPVTTHRQVALFVAGKTRLHSRYADRNVDPKRVRIAGHRGYAWDYTTPDGDWERAVWILGPHYSYRLLCTGTPATRDQFQRLCAAAASSLRITAI